MTAHDPTLVPILMYHSIADASSREDRVFTVRPRDFAGQVRALRDWGASTIDIASYVRALRAGSPLAPRTVVLTVDDGYADTAEVLAPTLTEVGFTATIFVSTATIGSEVRGTKMISWPQIHTLHDLGYEIGAHGHHHIALDTIPAARARDQMLTSREILEQRLGVAVESFAYPHGYWTPKLTQAARAAGFRSASAAKHGLSHPRDDLYALSRLVVHRDLPLARLLDMVDGRGVGVMTSQRVLARGAWRSVRRTQRILATVRRTPVRRGTIAPAGPTDADRLAS